MFIANRPTAAVTWPTLTFALWISNSQQTKTSDINAESRPHRSNIARARAVSPTCDAISVVPSNFIPTRNRPVPPSAVSRTLPYPSVAVRKSLPPCVRLPSLSPKRPLRCWWLCPILGSWGAN